MRIFLCRHGETTGDIENRYGGDYEDHLTPHGEEESEEMAEKLDGFGIEVIFSSPRIRAQETSKIISNELSVPTVTSQNLRERNHYGVLTGLKKSEAMKVFPAEVNKLEKNQLRPKITGSEDYDSFKKRVLDEFLKITKSKTHKIVCIVSHGGPIRCIVREILKLGEIKRLDDCAILEIESNGKEFSLVAADGIEFENKK